jgi:hypothetical protein
MVAEAGIGGPTMAALAVAFSDAPYPPAFGEPPSWDFGALRPRYGMWMTAHPR